VRCGTCGATGASGARFCDQCGAALAASPAETTPSGATAGDAGDTTEGGDRRIVTALFADLVDYVRMVAEHDPEVVRRRVRAALTVMADAIERLDGTREKFIGDAVFAVFGWPRAHDDDAVRAALAALDIRSSLRDLGDGAEAMEVRIGIATGEVVTSRADPARDDLALTGSAITTAARIQALARPAEILLDSATVSAARGRLVVADRGSFVLRGQSEPVRLHALEGEVGLGGYVAPRTRVIGTLVGRTDERDRLHALLERCRSTGAGGTFLVVGDPGIGKSRLLADLRGDAKALGMAWTWTENTSYGQAEPYRFARMFAQAAADEHGMDSGSFARALLFTPDLDDADARRYGGVIAAIARDAAFSGWEAEAPDMPADSAAMSATLGEVAGRYVDRLIETSGPRVVVVDDLHWIDASSGGALEVLVERAARLPLVVLAAMRPGPRPHWADLPAVGEIGLTGLSLPETAQLATQIARAAFDADGARRIHERTAGNPLFVTETVRASLDDGTLAWHDGRVTLTEGPVTNLPVTLRAVLGARIDALPPDAREALGVASVIGMRFDQARIEGLTGAAMAPGTLERVADAGLVALDRDGTWRFSHPLIHDTAYAGVLASRRRQLHGRLADQLEERYDPRSVSLIAVHRAASGDAVRAIPLLEEAAGAAMALGAATEAASFWRTAAGLTPDAAEAEGYRSRADAALAAARGA
jgi:class 3 adenylate cyclase